MTELDRVYWIGGGSGAGKTTVAQRVAARLGASVYSCDDAMSAHASRAVDTSPLLRAFATMSMDERWLLRSPQDMYETFHWFAGEAFALIIDDLERLPSGPVVAEGFRLLPRLVQPLLADRTRAVWLLPTPRFRVATFASRGSLWTIAGATSDPRRALDKLLARDRMFTNHLRLEVTALGLIGIDIDLPTTEGQLVHLVTTALGINSTVE